MRKIWGTTASWPFDDTVIAAARSAGAAEIIHIPCPALPMLVEGFNEVADGMADAARGERDRRIAATDWRLLKALEAGEALSAEWVAYRQALRDVPDQQGFPDEVIWPIEP